VRRGHESDDVTLGDVWKRPGLSPRDRSLVTVAVLAYYTGWPSGMAA
jgi:alkylhydroperoxidase/carboxymuconolactone decarboxylase family protein YurZ